MRFPPPPHDSPHQLSHLVWNIMQNGGILGSSQFMEATQILASLIAEHVENALDGKDDKVVI
jgi:hypothetical protein